MKRKSEGKEGGKKEKGGQGGKVETEGYARIGDEEGIDAHTIERRTTMAAESKNMTVQNPGRKEKKK